jgi:hypothetical protein
LSGRSFPLRTLNNIRVISATRFTHRILATAAVAVVGSGAAAQNSTRPRAESPARAVESDSTASPVGRNVRSRIGAAKRRHATARRTSDNAPLGRYAGANHAAYRDTVLDKLWPVAGPAPLPGAILPAHRIVAFYGNPLNRRMGLLGALPPEQMLRRLDEEVAEWQRLDPKTPIQPALHMIAVVAQADAGRDGKYRLRMDSATIERVYGWARSKNALMFVDVQVGLSTLQRELPVLERFLKRPDVHLGIDPEFSMKDGTRPGKKVGTYDAADINYASQFLAGLVTKYQLPPKILVVHRYTLDGVTNYRQISLDPRVQIVMDMDGFGEPWLKRDSFYRYIKKDPVQFVGWKQFTKRRNDNPATPREEVLRLYPVPVYIQLQ